ncbi:MAG: hypothetical protein M0R80_13375 [Proteobacteria bacterium]|jgi:hypothetical protein|nr:hypothetical protein [Pseudomonadota bacterium]
MVHLQLYVFGSEGIEVCFQCRMVLTEVAKGINSATGRAKIAGFKKGKESLANSI